MDSNNAASVKLIRRFKMPHSDAAVTQDAHLSVGNKLFR